MGDSRNLPEPSGEVTGGARAQPRPRRWHLKWLAALGLVGGLGYGAWFSVDRVREAAARSH
jgi:hypothetical protein